MKFTTHLSEKIWALWESHFESHINVMIKQTFFNPFRQFLVTASFFKPRIRKYHKPIICFSSHHTTQTLRALSHCIKFKKLIFIFDLLSSDHKFYPLKKDRIKGILNRKSHHDDASTIMLFKIHTFCDFASRNS